MHIHALPHYLAASVLATSLLACNVSRIESGKNAVDAGAGAGRTDGGIHDLPDEFADAAPRPEECGNGLDDDHNGLIDDGCGCAIGETQECFPGGIPDVCGGTQVCAGSAEFPSWGDCQDAPVPTEEICGDGIDQDCDGTDEECERPTAACDYLPHQTSTQTLRFSSPLSTVGECPWGVGDNLPMANGGMNARIEVTQSLTPPPHAVVCSLSFHVPQTSMYYDDFMYVLFDDVVVLSPSDWSSWLDKIDDLIIYDWLRVRGRNGGSPPAYCPGPGSTCALPDTETNGSISLQLGADAQRRLLDRAVTLGEYDVTVVATGDDNPDQDCDHSDFDFIVTYEYVVAGP